jgi:hypothetical protein
VINVGGGAGPAERDADPKDDEVDDIRRGIQEDLPQR